MRDFLIGLMIFLLLPNLYVDSVVFIAFKLKQDYIAKNLCVQKDEVVNTCNGSCVLTDQLKEVNEKQEDSKYPGNQETRIFPVYINSDNESFSVFLLEHLDGENKLSSTIPRIAWCDIFHPPQV